MPDSPPSRPILARLSFDSLTVVLCCLVLLISSLDLTGWFLKIPRLTSILLQYASMKPNTAICMALLAVSILLQRLPARASSTARFDASPIWLLLARLSVTVVFLIAAATLFEYISEKNLGLDLFILKVGPDRLSTIPGRMAQLSAVSFVLLSVALAVLDRKPRLSLTFVFSSGGLCLSAMIGFLYRAGPFLGIPRLQPISLLTAISFLFLQAAILCVRPQQEPLYSLARANRGGRTQRLLLGVTILPIIVAIPLIVALQVDLLHAPLALAILVVVLICIQTFILWQDSKALVRVEDDRNRAEQALLQSEKLAVVGRLAASISHEINNPLEAIGNILYLVRTAETRESAQEYAMMAEQELARVAQITTQTLSFYRELRNPAPHMIASIVDSALSLLSGKISTARVQVRAEFQDDVQPVLCREGELRQVFVNLISNAIEATPQGGQLVVRVHPATAWSAGNHTHGVRILIADSGRGIPPELRKRIFEPFFTTKAHETGNGLGLWVVQDLIEKQHGTMTMRSGTRPGWQGTTFNLFLPYDSIETPATADSYGAGEATVAVEPA